MLYARIVIGLSVSLLSGLLLFAGSAKAAADVGPSLTDAGQVQSTVDEVDAITETAPNCRYGVSAWETNFLDQLRVGWIQNFGRNAPSNLSSDIEYISLVNVRQDIRRDENGQTVERYPTYRLIPSLDQLARLLEQYPGRLWISGNEPDRQFHQDDTQPYVYAMAYHELYHFIKKHDPTAQVAIAGLVGVTPGRLQYLDLVWESYRNRYGTNMPVDVWTFHDYIFAEAHADGRWSNAAVALDTDIELAILDAEGDASLCSRDDVYCKAEHDSIDVFKEQVVAMRTWMKEHGQQNKPLVLTEFGILYPYQLVNNECTLKDEYGNCFSPQRAADFMVKTYEYLENAKDPEIGFPLDENRLVQQWMWFSMPYPLAASVWNPSLLATADLSELTIVGQTHLREVNKRPLSQNLRYENENGDFVQSAQVGQSVTLSAPVYNNGNTTIKQPVTVAFYADQAKTKQIGTATIPAGIRGCARRPYVASVEWDASLSPGWHSYWVTVDSSGVVSESNEQDNNGQGRLLVTEEVLYLPAIAR